MLDQLRKALSKYKTPVKTSNTLDLEFTRNETMTVGVEIELQIVNRANLELVDLSDDLIARLKPHSKQFVPEWFKSLIELNSTPHKNINDMEPEIATQLGLAQREADYLGCDLMGSGCHPFMHYGDLEMRDHARYGIMLERNQWLARRWMVSGMHIHIGMSSANNCIRYMHYFEHFIPHFIALSASSPYWNHTDTGLDSCRSIISESLSTAALMYTVNSWPEMKELVKKLERSKTITSLKDLHWDIRPSPTYGTLEIRVCDMPTNIQDVMAIAAFAHTLALWFDGNADWLANMPKPAMWMARENKWRALRYGMDAEIITTDSGRTVPLKDDFNKILERVAVTAQAHGYARYMEHIRSIVDKGNSSSRQRRIFEATGSMQEIVKHNLLELKEGRSIYPPSQENTARLAQT